MGCCRLRKGFCCLSLETGTKIVGALEILTVILMLALNVTDASVLGILQDIFAILLGLFLIAAAILKNIVMLKIYLAVSMFQILWTLLYLVLLVEDEVGKHIEVNGGDAMDVALIVSTILAMSIILYFWLIVYSFHVDVKYEKMMASLQRGTDQN